MTSGTTAADSAVCIFCLKTKILFTGSGIFSFRTMRIAEKVDVLFYFILSSGGWGKIKLTLTTLPCIFIRVCRFNSMLSIFHSDRKPNFRKEIGVDNLSSVFFPDVQLLH